MTKPHSRVAGALGLVFVSLLAASLACYSGQIPGVLELTPYHTPTPLPVAENAKFGVLQTVLAPGEAGRAFFNLTLDPEPLLPNAMNSKTSCLNDSAARVLYSGVGSDGVVYYLLDCNGSVGWASEARLAGPLEFAREDLAITVAPPGTQAVPMLDDLFKPLPFNPLQTCKPETIVMVTQLQASDPDGDGTKEIFYQIDCPTSAGPLKGWVTNADLVGPVEINVGDRALAIAPQDADADTQYQLASEPAPVTEANAVAGECPEGSILEAKEARRAGDRVYFKMACGEIEGWVDQDRFVGPLLYDVGVNVLVYVPSIPVFEDELPADSSAPAEEVETTVVEEASAETPADGGEVGQRRVVEYTPPLYLTSKPGPAIPAGEDANVVGQCTSGTPATIQEYTGLDAVYYRIQCDECVAQETDVDGEAICTAYETRDGWVLQRNLQGPLEFTIGDQVVLKSSSKAIQTDEDGTKYARLPANLTGAASVGQYTEFTGRCPLEASMEIIGVQLEKARTSSKISFFYEVQCMGQRAIVQQVKTDASATRTEITYSPDEELVSGFLSARDVQAVSQ